jgi:hypothetical protein
VLVVNVGRSEQETTNLKETSEKNKVCEKKAEISVVALRSYYSVALAEQECTC